MKVADTSKDIELKSKEAMNEQINNIDNSKLVTEKK